MTEQKFIKDVISKCRKEKQLTQEQLADLLNVSNKTVSKWERGISYPDITLIPMLAKVLDINISDLFNVQETSIKKKNLENEVFNVERINVYVLQMFIAICILVGSILFGALSVVLVPHRVVITLCCIFSITAIFTSLALTFFSSYKFYYFFRDKLHKRTYLMTFVKYTSIYFLIIYMFIMIYNAFDIKDNFLSLILVIVIHLAFTIIPFLFVEKRIHICKINIFNRLRIVSIIFFSIGCLLYLLTGTIISLVLLGLSQIINYITIFIQIKKFNIEGDLN